MWSENSTVCGPTLKKRYLKTQFTINCEREELDGRNTMETPSMATCITGKMHLHYFKI